MRLFLVFQTNRTMDMSQLPDEVREKLAELELELSEGGLIVRRDEEEKFWYESERNISRSNNILIAEHAWCLSPISTRYSHVFEYHFRVIIQFSPILLSVESIASRAWREHFFLTVSLFSVGDITQKGYEKKRQRLLAPYLSSGANGSQTAAATAQGKQRWFHFH